MMAFVLAISYLEHEFLISGKSTIRRILVEMQGSNPFPIIKN